MAAAQSPTLPERRVIVHHLSDLQYVDRDGGGQNDRLDKYLAYLDKIPADRQPQLVVITGDLTSTGKQSDLSAVAQILRGGFSRWAGHLREHIIVVPGPRDVNWEDRDTVGLGAFYKIFEEFATPVRSSAASGGAAPISAQRDVAVYTIDTCYGPDELNPGLAQQFKAQEQTLNGYSQERARFGRRFLGIFARYPYRPRRVDRVRAREAILGRLRTGFLQMTESGRQRELYSGRITKVDAEQFEAWSQDPVQRATNGTTQYDALKVLVTYHPLVIRRDQELPAGQSTTEYYKQVARAARAAGFHLALHGNIHNPQLLSDMAVHEGPDNQRPIRQMGAASLGGSGVFNEITAVFHQGDTGGAWRLDHRLVDLDSDGESVKSAVALLNASEDAEKRIKALNEAATQRSEFERSLRFAMRRFAETIYTSRPVAWSAQGTETSLPQNTLNLLDDVIREVIFKGRDVRVRLLVKQKAETGGAPKLVASFLDPAMTDGPEELVYPASVAAWSLILGRSLVYSEVMKSSTNKEDNDWLRRTNKIPDLLAALKVKQDEAHGMSYPGANDGTRYQELITALNDIRTATDGANDPHIAGAKLYQGSTSSKSYPDFVCVPYPLRASGGNLPTVPEIVVLDVGVRQASATQHAPGVSADAPLISPAQVEMLEVVTEFIGVVLTTADALGKPRGPWSDRIGTGV